MKKAFHLGDVLSITSGILVSPSGIDGIYSILNFLTGDNLYTHQLGRGMQVAAPILLERYSEVRPFNEELLTAAKAPGWGSDTAEAWMIAAAAKFCTGIRMAPYIELEPLPENAWLSIDPVKELVAMVGEDRVLVLRTDNSDTP